MVECDKARFEQAVKSLHDRYGDFIASLLTFIAEKLGEEAVKEALERVFDEVYRESPLWKTLKDLPHEEAVKTFVCIHKAHYSRFHIEEDKDKTVIVLDYCGSGGRIDREGKCGKTSKAYSWSFNKPNVNYYCCHCDLFFNQLIRQLGIDFIKIEHGEPCLNIIFKRKT
jgi:hypothetical protein